MKLFLAAKLVSVLALGRGGMVVAQAVWEPSNQLIADDSDPVLSPPIAEIDFVTAQDYGFGWKVAISGDTALLGSRHSGQFIPGTPDNPAVQEPGLGNARFFDLSTNEQEILIADDGGGGKYYGYTVALDDNTAIVGTYRESDLTATAFVFVRDNFGLWTQQAMLTPDPSLQDIVPQVALDGNIAVVGCASWNSARGKVFVYERVGNDWGIPVELVASDGEINDQFGKAVGISGDNLIIGAIEAIGTNNPGKVYFFRKSEGQGWFEAMSFAPDNIPAGHDYLDFGGAVAIDGETALVSSSNYGFDVYIYMHAGGGIWYLAGKIDERGINDCFGCSVDIKGNFAVIGARDFGWTSTNGGTANGNAYFYERNGMEWIPKSSFHSSFGFFLGASVAMGNGKALVSADGMTSNNYNGQQVGSVYVFEENVATISPTISPTPEPVRFWCMSGLFGDPHISTFDDLRFDCQAAGEFVMAKSLENADFMIQERFSAIDPSQTCTQMSVSTGVVMQGGSNTPKIQISTPRTGHWSLNTVNSCPIDFYVDGQEMVLPESQTKTYDMGGTVYDNWIQGPGLVTVDNWGEWINIYNTETYDGISIGVEMSERFGCHFFVRHSISVNPIVETKYGLLGTCNYDPSDDWRATDGSVLTPPATPEEALFSTAYTYCTTWCIQSEIDSLFTYGLGESFASINKCSEPYLNTIESQFASPPQVLLDTCGSSVACMVDGLCGDMNDAMKTLENEALLGTGPTGAPSDWEIIYNDMIVDLSVNSTDEISFNYDISTGRDYLTEIFQADCASPIEITDTSVTLTSDTRQPKTAFHDTLILTYDVDKSSVAGSSIWNDLTSQIELCQVVQLITPALGNDPMMVFQTDKRVMSIDFDLTVDFELNIDLGAGNVGQGSGSTEVDSYIKACKCDSVQGFTCDTSSLLPNSELHVCIWSVSSEVEIHFLEDMFISQGVTALTVIENDNIRETRVTTREYLPAQNGVAVTTRVPANLFSFQPGESIIIEGTLETKLFEVSRRKLIGESATEEFDKEASFKLRVGLAAPDAIEGFSSNSASLADYAEGLACLGTAIILMFAR